MQAPIQSKKRGRPKLDVIPLSRERIVAAAAQVLATGAADVSMRAVASELGVHVMALYHYFRDKQALLDAMVEQAFAPLYDLRPQLLELTTAEHRLRLLASTYLGCVAEAVPLTRHLALQDGAPLTTMFNSLFDTAVGSGSPPSAAKAAMRDVLVDYLHGVALAGANHAAKALKVGWPVLMGGLKPYLVPTSATEGADPTCHV